MVPRRCRARRWKSRQTSLDQIAGPGNITPLAVLYGFKGFFVRSGVNFQVFYATPDNERLIPGVLWDAAGKDVTRQQVAGIPGAVPTVEVTAGVRRRPRRTQCHCSRRQCSGWLVRPRRRASTC